MDLLLYKIELYLCLIGKLERVVLPLFDDDRIVGVHLQIAPSVNAFIFQVYLPCSNHSVAVYIVGLA